MVSRAEPSLSEMIIELIAQADLSFWFVSGRGLGAICLTVIAIVFLIRSKPSIALMLSAAQLFASRGK